MASSASNNSISRRAEGLNMTLNFFGSTASFQFLYQSIGCNAAVCRIFGGCLFHPRFKGRGIFNKVVGKVFLRYMVKDSCGLAIGSNDNVLLNRGIKDIHCLLFEFFYTCKTHSDSPFSKLYNSVTIFGRECQGEKQRCQNWLIRFIMGADVNESNTIVS